MKAPTQDEIRCFTLSLPTASLSKGVLKTGKNITEAKLDLSTCFAQLFTVQYGAVVPKSRRKPAIRESEPALISTPEISENTS